MSIDVNYVGGLLKIVEACTGHSGKLAALSNAAMGELMTLNGKLRDEAVEAAKAEQEAKAAEEANKVEGEPAPEPDEPTVFTDENPNPVPTRRL